MKLFNMKNLNRQKREEDLLCYLAIKPHNEDWKKKKNWERTNPILILIENLLFFSILYIYVILNVQRSENGCHVRCMRLIDALDPTSSLSAFDLLF